MMKTLLLIMIVIGSGSIGNRSATMRTMIWKIPDPTTGLVVQESRASHLTEAIRREIGMRAVRSTVLHAHDVTKMIIVMSMLTMLRMITAFQQHRAKKIDSAAPVSLVDMNRDETGTETVTEITDEKSVIVTANGLDTTVKKLTHLRTKMSEGVPGSIKRIMKAMAMAPIVLRRLRRQWLRPLPWTPTRWSERQEIRSEC